MRNLAIASFLLLTLVAPPAWTAESPRIEPDIVYGHKDGLAMTMDVHRPADANGAAVLFVVSGGWFSRWAPPERMAPLFAPYLEKGYTVFAVRHGSSPRYSIPEAISDLRRAVRFVRFNAERLQVDGDRLGALGMSAGGHLALLLGTTGENAVDGGGTLERTSSRIGAVVALVPPTDLRVAVWESPKSLPAYRGFPALDLPMKEAEENSPLVHVTPDDAPSLVFAGGKDELVPADHGRWIAKALEKQNVKHKLIVFPEAGHGLEGEQNWATIRREATAWFDTHLKKRSSTR